MSGHFTRWMRCIDSNQQTVYSTRTSSTHGIECNTQDQASAYTTVHEREEKKEENYYRKEEN